MKLFHGSNVEIEEIKLSMCNPYKDFGQGFYLTSIYQQAELMSKRTTLISGFGSPFITTYYFDETALSSNELKVKLFSEPSKEWALFILKNRDKKNEITENYDIVFGPVADDGVVFQLELYTKDYIPLDKLVERITFRKLNNQYFFGTEKSIKLLRKI